MILRLLCDTCGPSYPRQSDPDPPSSGSPASGDSGGTYRIMVTLKNHREKEENRLKRRQEVPDVDAPREEAWGPCAVGVQDYSI